MKNNSLKQKIMVGTLPLAVLINIFCSGCTINHKNIFKESKKPIPLVKYIGDQKPKNEQELAYERALQSLDEFEEICGSNYNIIQEYNCGILGDIGKSISNGINSAVSAVKSVVSTVSNYVNSGSNSSKNTSSGNTQTSQSSTGKQSSSSHSDSTNSNKDSGSSSKSTYDKVVEFTGIKWAADKIATGIEKEIDYGKNTVDKVGSFINNCADFVDNGAVSGADMIIESGKLVKREVGNVVDVMQNFSTEFDKEEFKKDPATYTIGSVLNPFSEEINYVHAHSVEPIDKVFYSAKEKFNTFVKDNFGGIQDALKDLKVIYPPTYIPDETIKLLETNGVNIRKTPLYEGNNVVLKKLDSAIRWKVGSDLESIASIVKGAKNLPDMVIDDSSLTGEFILAKYGGRINPAFAAPLVYDSGKGVIDIIVDAAYAPMGDKLATFKKRVSEALPIVSLFSVANAGLNMAETKIKTAYYRNPQWKLVNKPKIKPEVDLNSGEVQGIPIEELYFTHQSNDIPGTLTTKKINLVESGQKPGMPNVYEIRTPNGQSKLVVSDGVGRTTRIFLKDGKAVIPAKILNKGPLNINEIEWGYYIEHRLYDDLGKGVKNWKLYNAGSIAEQLNPEFANQIQYKSSSGNTVQYTYNNPKTGDVIDVTRYIPKEDWAKINPPGTNFGLITWKSGNGNREEKYVYDSESETLYPLNEVRDNGKTVENKAEGSGVVFSFIETEGIAFEKSSNDPIDSKLATNMCSDNFSPKAGSSSNKTNTTVTIKKVKSIKEAQTKLGEIFTDYEILKDYMIKNEVSEGAVEQELNQVKLTLMNYIKNSGIDEIITGSEVGANEPLTRSYIEDYVNNKKNAMIKLLSDNLKEQGIKTSSAKDYDTIINNTVEEYITSLKKELLEICQNCLNEQEYDTQIQKAEPNEVNLSDLIKSATNKNIMQKQEEPNPYIISEPQTSRDILINHLNQNTVTPKLPQEYTDQEIELIAEDILKPIGPYSGNLKTDGFTPVEKASREIIWYDAYKLDGEIREIVLDKGAVGFEKSRQLYKNQRIRQIEWDCHINIK